MTVFYIETGHGCGLREHRTQAAAEKAALREAGTFAGVRAVREATAQEISWVASMGGHVPEAARKLLEKRRAR